MNTDQKSDSSGSKKWNWSFDNPLKAYRHAGPLFGTGIQLAATVVILFFIGNWLDEQWKTAPWLMVVCISIGIVGGLIKFIKTVNDISKSEERERTESKSP